MKTHPWFEKGKEAIQQLGLGITDYYFCPICLRGFQNFSLTDPEGLSREDVPPRHYGGRKLVLTCRDCNSRAGAGIDSQLARNEKFRKIGRPGGVPAQVSIGNSSAWAWAHLEVHSTGNRILVSPHNNPDVVRLQKKQLESAGDGTQIRFSFDLGNKRHAHFSLLRAAYLATFAKFGYRYVVRKVFDPLRHLIESPGSADGDHYYLSLPKAATGQQIGFITNPWWAVSLVVQSGSHLICLPVFDNDDIYDRIADAKLQMVGTGEVALKMKMLPFPEEPEHLFDFDPKLATDCVSSLSRCRVPPKQSD